MANKQAARVVTNDLRIRKAPRLGMDTRTNTFLQYGQTLQVDLDLETTADGFVWWEHADGWSAARAENNTEVYIELSAPAGAPAGAPAAEPVNEAGSWKFHVLTGGLRVHASASVSSAVNGRLVKYQTINVDTSSRTVNEGYVWWKHDAGGWSISGSTNNIQRFMEPYPQPRLPDGIDGFAANLLPIHWTWASQVDPITAPAAFDCGPACVYMLLLSYGKASPGLTVEDVAKDMPGKTGASQLITLAAMNPFNLTLSHIGPIPFEPPDVDQFSRALRAEIDNDKGVVLKVWYGAMGLNNPTAGSGAFEHWVVVIGYDNEKFFINDPLWYGWDRDGQGGSTIPIDAESLWNGHRAAIFKAAIS